MVNLDELMKLREAANLPFSIYKECQLDDQHEEIRDANRFYVKNLNDEQDKYILAACNAVPELVQRIRELEAQVSAAKTKQFSALEPCRIVSNNNSTPPEWLMRRFTEVK